MKQLRSYVKELSEASLVKIGKNIGIFIFLIALWYFYFIGHVPSESMEPTIKKGSLVVYERQFSELSVGDVVTFKHPQTQVFIVKRIVAINGELFWLEGDNIDNSIDSRSFGYVEKINIRGKARYVLSFFKVNEIRITH